MKNNKKCISKKAQLAYASAFVGIISGIILFVIGEVLHADTMTRIMFIVLGIMLIIASAGGVCVLQLSYGSFECPDCGEKFTPSIREYIFAPHIFNKRYLRCPGCGDKKMCKFKFDE